MTSRMILYNENEALISLPEESLLELKRVGVWRSLLIYCLKYINDICEINQFIWSGWRCWTSGPPNRMTSGPSFNKQKKHSSKLYLSSVGFPDKSMNLYQQNMKIGLPIINGHPECWTCAWLSLYGSWESSLSSILVWVGGDCTL